MKDCKTVVLAAVAVATLALTACGSSSGGNSSGGSSSGGSNAKGGRTQVVLDVLPNAENAALYLGVSKGLFAKNGLDVKIVPIPAGGSTTVGNAISGKAQFAVTVYAGLFEAFSKGLPVVSVGPISAGPPANEPDQNQLLVLKSSGISRPRDLEGKKVAVITLGSGNYVQVQEAVGADGGDPSKVQFVSIQFAQMAGALLQKRVDTVATTEPFVTQISQQAKTVNVAPLDLATGPNSPLGAVITSKTYASSHATVVEQFQRGLYASLQYASTHSAEVRKALPSIAGVSSGLAQKVLLPHYPTSINREALTKLNTDMVKFGLLKAPVNLDKVLLTFPVK